MKYLLTLHLLFPAAWLPAQSIYSKAFGHPGGPALIFIHAQVAAVAKIAGKGHLQYLEHASHTLFIDRQDAFVPAPVTWLQPHRR